MTIRLGFMPAFAITAFLVMLGLSAASAEPYANPYAYAYAPQAAPQFAPADEQASDAQVSPDLQRQIVGYATQEAPGTIIVDTPNTYLYYVLGGGQAIRYGIGVGREGYTWSGVHRIARKREWPDWYPPADMIERQPYLPRMTAGGPGNPLGARALYIGGTEYRIHGTNNPASIGRQVSSGCIRLTNPDIIDLFARVKLGDKVIVLPQSATREARAPAAVGNLAPRTGPVQYQPAANSGNIRAFGLY